MLRTTLALVLVALLSRPVLADDKKDTTPQPAPKKQEKQKGNRRANQSRVQPGLRFVLNLKVREELKLSDDQKAKLEKIVQEYHAQRVRLYETLSGLQGEEQQKKRAEVSKKMREQDTELNKKISPTLNPEQIARLGQIALQMHGLRALHGRRMAEKLKLTDQQKKQLQQIDVAATKKRIQLAREVDSGNLEQAEYRNKMDELKKDSDTKSVDVLTDQQKAEFEKLQGAKFEFFNSNRLKSRAVPQQSKPRAAKEASDQARKDSSGRQVNHDPDSSRAEREVTVRPETALL